MCMAEEEEAPPAEVWPKTGSFVFPNGARYGVCLVAPALSHGSSFFLACLRILTSLPGCASELTVGNDSGIRRGIHKEAGDRAT